MSTLLIVLKQQLAEKKEKENGSELAFKVKLPTLLGGSYY